MHNGINRIKEFGEYLRAIRVKPSVETAKADATRVEKPRIILYKNKPHLTNMQAITTHKRKYNVENPYVVVDKTNNTMYYMRKDKVIEKHEITRGKNVGDGYRPFSNATPYYNSLPALTGAGVFTVVPRKWSPYLGHEPLFMLYANGKKTSMAIHSPASPLRLSALKNDNKNDNKISYGCISPDLGILKRWYDNKLLQYGDSVYIIPEINGNYIYENSNGKLTTHFSINPRTYKNVGYPTRELFYNKSE